jgi:cytochrome c-type biogenesis protein CcmH/NrfG
MRFIVYFSLLLGCVSLAGCATGSLTAKDDPESRDYLLLKDQADQAYIKKQYEIAATKYLHLTRTVPRDAEVWFRLGNIYARTHRPEEAIKAYRESVLRDPTFSKAWHNMGIVHMRQAANAYLSLQKHAKPDDPIKDIALRRLNGLYELMPVQQESSKQEQNRDAPDEAVIEE